MQTCCFYEIKMPQTFIPHHFNKTIIQTMVATFNVWQGKV